MRHLVTLIALVALVIGNALLLHIAIGPPDDLGWHIGIYGVYAAFWVVATMAYMKYMEGRRLFTHFVHQGYTEGAADEQVERIQSLRDFAKRRQPKIDKERAEYDRLRQKFEGDTTVDPSFASLKREYEKVSAKAHERAAKSSVEGAKES